MKHNFCITLLYRKRENETSQKITNIEFYGSLLQAHRAFYGLSFALPLSDCESITLFQGENQISRTTFTHSQKVR